MSHEHLPPLTDPSLYPRVPDVPPPSGDDTLSSDASPSTSRGRNTRAGAVAGIVAAGALAVGIGVAVTTHGSASAQTNRQVGGQVGGPAGAGALGGAPGGGGPGGGIDGEQHVSGTITAVGSASITVRSTSGTATYGVNGTTEITVNGAAGSLSALKPGTAVTVHVYPSGSSLLAERVIVGTDPGFGPPAGGGRDDSGPTGQQAPATTT